VSVGGASSGSGNLISGNGSGVFVSSNNGVTIQGNLIGSDATGAYAIPNWAGVLVLGDGVLVGGTGPLEGNLISGNTAYGIRVNGAGSVTIQGNRIGTDGSGSGPLGNGEQGIRLDYTTDGLSVIGGNTAGAGNVVAFNGGAGVDFLITTAYAGLRTNSFHSNVGLGIDLGSDGVTSNDPGDGDGGANNGQNYPVIAGVVRGATDTTIDGTLNSLGSTTFEIEFFSSSNCDPSAYGEGEIYLGYTAVSTDAGGDAAFNVTLPVTVPQGAFMTATATRLYGGGDQTSEFSACFQVIDLDSLIFADGFESGNTTAW
jgi:parallel beta-helix repeat protein